MERKKEIKKNKIHALSHQHAPPGSHIYALHCWLLLLYLPCFIAKRQRSETEGLSSPSSTRGAQSRGAIRQETPAAAAAAARTRTLGSSSKLGPMGRSPCCEKAHTNKGAWTKEEDQRLIAYIKAHGEGCWRSLPKAAGLLRCGKSCRLRWMNYLRPDLKRGNFTDDDDELIIKLHALLGNK